MDARLLKYFLSVYENHGINAASKILHISQPAVTKSIHKLEEKLGVQLFERRPSGIVPTVYADILARRARLMDVEYRSAIAEINATKGGGKGFIRIGAGPVWYSNLLPPILDAFLKEHPDMRINLQSGVIDTLFPGLEAGEFDLICASLDFPNKPNIVQEAIINLEHAVIASVDHPLASLEVVQPAMLAEYPWIAIANDHVGTGRIWSYFAAFGSPPPHIALETSSPTLMFEMIPRGQFLAHIPARMLEQADKLGICTLNVHGPFWETPAGIAYRQSSHLLPALRQLIKAIRTNVQ